MVTLYQCKPAFQHWLRPWVRQLAEWRVSPNSITIAAILLSAAMGLAIVLAPQSRMVLLLLPPVLFGRMALNAVDGMLAREHDLTTRLGGILNELGDVVSDAALYLPFALIPTVSAVWIVLIVLLAILTEMAGVLGLAMAQTRCYEGPMGKSDRALVFGAVALALGLGVEPSLWLNGVWVGVVLLQLVTLVNRVRAMLREEVPCS
jgi:CDP-diacylglycerol--glycerol-3-phosphate 3-phosphatidyltransferase